MAEHTAIEFGAKRGESKVFHLIFLAQGGYVVEETVRTPIGRFETYEEAEQFRAGMSRSPHRPLADGELRSGVNVPWRLKGHAMQRNPGRDRPWRCECGEEYVLDQSESWDLHRAHKAARANA